MITALLHLLRLLPFLCGDHRHLALENLALRYQLAVYRRTAPRPKLRTTDRLLWVALAKVWPSWKAGPSHRVARNRPAVAAPPLPRALDQAVRPAHRRPAARQRRGQDADHPHGRSQSALGCSQNPRGAVEARHSCCRAHRLSAAPEAVHSTVPDLANLPRQPRPGPGFHRPLHRPQRPPAGVLRPRRARPRPPARSPLQRHRASHCHLGGPADRGRLPGRHRAVLPPPRSRPGLRRAVPAAREGLGHQRSSHGAAISLAKSVRGAAHRLRPARLPQSRRRPWRAASATHLDCVLRVLPSRAHSPLARQGCPRRPANRTARAGHDHRDSRSRWPASSLRPPGGVVRHRTRRSHARTHAGRSPALLLAAVPSSTAPPLPPPPPQPTPPARRAGPPPPPHPPPPA